MIYMEPHMLGWEPLMKSWLNNLPKTFTSENKELISDIYKRFLPCCLDFVKKAGFKVCAVILWTSPFTACLTHTCPHTHIPLHTYIPSHTHTHTPH